MDQEPERIGNARWTFERFRQHAAHEAKVLHAKFMVSLAEALEATDEEKEKLFLAWVEDATEPRASSVERNPGPGYPSFYVPAHN